MLEMLKIFWNGYHLLLQPLKDKVNYLWIDTAGNPLGIGISRALSILVGVTWDVEIEEGEYV